MTIQEAIGAMLRTESLALSPLVADRIYWYQPPPSPEFPMIVFRQSSERYMAPDMTSEGDVIDAQLDFQIFSRASIAEAHEVAAALRVWMHGWRGDTPSTDPGFYIQRIERVNQEDISEREYLEQGLFVVGQTYQIIARAATT
jgi:hypothetical protein